MSVCWKACGARLHSSQIERRKKKRKRKYNKNLPLALFLKGNSPPVCAPREVLCTQSLQAET
jgi:hypothetical protein